MTLLVGWHPRRALQRSAVSQLQVSAEACGDFGDFGVIAWCADSLGSLGELPPWGDCCRLSTLAPMPCTGKWVKSCSLGPAVLGFPWQVLCDSSPVWGGVVEPPPGLFA